MRKLITGGAIVNDNRCFKGSIIIENDLIHDVIEGEELPSGDFDEMVDATNCCILPGVIDTHVHFREPGLEEKATIQSETRAAAYGGITSFFDMPNTLPQTTTLETLAEKFAIAKQQSYINYTFFFGATNGNAALINQLDVHSIPGVKLFMGASTGNMLVDRLTALEAIFKVTAEKGLPIMTHCEDSTIISHNMQRAKERYGDDPPIEQHHLIRSEEACWQSSQLAVKLSLAHKTHLHIAHLSTARELSLIADSEVAKWVTLEAVIAHLYFTNEDYSTRKARIKCNPSVKTLADRAALRAALSDGRISTVATDHAPHLFSQKQGGCAKATSGMPMIQFSLVTMLELVDKGVITIERLVDLMAHTPARLFAIRNRGYLRKGFKADIAIVAPHRPWTVEKQLIESKCKWSPMEGHTYNWKVLHTFCNGNHVLNEGRFDESCRGEKLLFR